MSSTIPYYTQAEQVTAMGPGAVYHAVPAYHAGAACAPGGGGVMRGLEWVLALLLLVLLGWLIYQAVRWFMNLNNPPQMAGAAMAPRPAQLGTGCCPCAAPAASGFGAGAGAGARAGTGSFFVATPAAVGASPAPQYGSPARQYGSPARQFGSPARQYASPAPQYGAPLTRYAAPSAASYGASPYDAQPATYYAQDGSAYGQSDLDASYAQTCVPSDAGSPHPALQGMGASRSGFARLPSAA